MENVLKLEHVCKSFANSVGHADEATNALHDITAEFRSGEFVSIIGPSGCGKSTILRLVAGLIVPTTGTLTLNGKPIDGPDPSRGIVFQKPTLFPWLTVEQNVAFTLKMRGLLRGREGEVEELLRSADLWGFRKNWPYQLSGGMAQRAAVIRTMAGEPQVFLLDEPFGALDAFTRMNMQDMLLRMWQRARGLMIMVTHDIDEAIYMGTRVLVMAPRPGRIFEDVPVTMPYPRKRTSDEFIELRRYCMDRLSFDRRSKDD